MPSSRIEMPPCRSLCDANAPCAGRRSRGIDESAGRTGSDDGPPLPPDSPVDPRSSHAVHDAFFPHVPSRRSRASPHAGDATLRVSVSPDRFKSSVVECPPHKTRAALRRVAVGPTLLIEQHPRRAAVVRVTVSAAQPMNAPVGDNDHATSPRWPSCGPLAARPL